MTETDSAIHAKRAIEAAEPKFEDAWLDWFRQTNSRLSDIETHACCSAFYAGVRAAYRIHLESLADEKAASPRKT